MKKQNHRYILVILTTLILLGIGLFYDEDSRRLPSVPDDLVEHTFLRTREMGVCDTMTGDVLVTVIFVDDTESKWTTADREDIQKQLEETAEVIMEEAAGYGAELELSIQYLQSVTKDSFTISDFEDWVDSALINAGLEPMQSAEESIKKHHHVKEAPIIFYVNRVGRSFSAYRIQEDSPEYSILYNRESYSFWHELNHLFGAVDYYLLGEVKETARQYFSDSIMLVDTEEYMTDSLTAYLIGWTDELSAEAIEFLRETADVTEEELAEEKVEELFTGYGTKQFEDGTYTGDLVDGTRQGKGKMSWDDGMVYDGEWVCNERCGQGTCYYTDGSVYAGEWKDDKRHGQGTMTYADGAAYVGAWEDGKMQGQGIFSQPGEDIK